MTFKTRDLVMIALFGALWGAIEISFGSILNGLHLPFGGAILSAMGLTVVLTGRLFVPRPGATLFAGVIATLLKLLSIGGVIVGPMIGILTESLLAEMALTLFVRPSRPAFLLAGALGPAWTLVQPFVTGLLLFGRDTMEIWLGLAQEASSLLGVAGTATFWLVGILLGLHMLLGASSGWLAWEAGKLLQVRLGGNATLREPLTKPEEIT